MFHHNHSTPIPTPAPNATVAPPKFKIPTCDDDEPFFLVQVALALVAIGVALFMNREWKRVPDGKTPFFGRPYIIIVFIMAIIYWNLIPNCIMFVFYHTLAPGIFPMVKPMVCLMVDGFPIMQTFLFFTAFNIIFFFKPEDMKREVGDLVFTNEGLENVEGGGKGKLLLLGTNSRGALFNEALERSRDGRLNAKPMLVDFLVLFHTFLKPNAQAIGAITADEPDPRSVLNVLKPKQFGDSKLGIPLADASVDKVVLSPFFRQMEPIGDFFMTPEEDRRVRMAKLLSEALRVLKPGGLLICADAVMSILLLQADLRDLGFQATITEAPSNKKCPLEFKPSRLILRLTKTENVSKQALDEVQQENTSQLHLSFVPLDDTDPASPGSAPTEASKLLNGDDNDYVPPSKRPLLTKTFVVVCAVQVCIAVLLIIASGALYSPLNYPDNIVLSARLNNLTPSIATSYFSLAFFSRQFLLNSQGDKDKHLGHLIGKSVGTDMIAIVVSCLFNAILWVPQFCVQLALNESSVSDGGKTAISIALSISIGVGLYKYGTYSSKKKTFKSRDLPMEYFKKA